MKIKLFQIDAFTDKIFAGNPAAVCPLDRWLPENVMQQIATENNQAETAFFVRNRGRFDIRWFTPAVEVDLCGHATLASAHVVLSLLEPTRDKVNFRTLKAGVLTVARQGDMLMMDFPARPAVAVEAPPGLLAALGGAPREVLKARDHMVIYGSAAEVAALKPDFTALGKIDCWAAIATAPGEDGIDFVSRFFAPRQGIDEDPATGSSHCTLLPYWANRLGKRELKARQLSRRVGTLTCALNGDRVAIGGRAVLYLEGQITV